MRACTATSVLERNAHLRLEISEPIYQKIFHLPLTIQHRQEHLLVAHCTAQRRSMQEGNFKADTDQMINNQSSRTSVKGILDMPIHNSSIYSLFKELEQLANSFCTVSILSWSPCCESQAVWFIIFLITYSNVWELSNFSFFGSKKRYFFITVFSRFIDLCHQL